MRKEIVYYIGVIHDLRDDSQGFVTRLFKFKQVEGIILDGPNVNGAFVNMTGNDIDLLSTPSYTFQAKVTDYASRFKLVFAANNSDLVGEGNDNFAFISNGMIIVNGTGTLQVFDVLGHEIINKQLSVLPPVRSVSP